MIEHDIEFKFRTEDLNGTILYAPGSNKDQSCEIWIQKLCWEIVFFRNHNFAISENHNFPNSYEG